MSESLEDEAPQPETGEFHLEEVVAEYPGLLKLGDEYQLPCFVLSNKKRVLIMREVVHLLTGNRKGGFERYTNAAGVREWMPQKFVDRPHKEAAIAFRVSGQIAYGYEADDVIAICEAYLKARQTGTIKPTQHGLAERAEVIIRACAKTGLVALIDEATGFQAVRDAEDLQVRIRAYLSDTLNEWTRTFPNEFFDNFYRLEGRPVPVPRKPYPKRFGRYVMQFVYDTLDPGIADWLRKNNPNPQWKEHHHQWFNKEFGYPKLKFHLMEVMGIQKASTTLERFKENIARAYAEARDNRRTRLKEAQQERERARREASGETETDRYPLFTYL
jgi:hypothetical protein